MNHFTAQFEGLQCEWKLPITNWKIAETAIAPLISRIRNCHSSVRSSADMAFILSALGHFHCGKFNMASTGTKNDIVPPCERLNELFCCICSYLHANFAVCVITWTIGKRHPHVHCMNVTMPVTNIMVDIISPRAGSSSLMHRAGVKMNGIETIAPIMVK